MSLFDEKRISQLNSFEYNSACSMSRSFSRFIFQQTKQSFIKNGHLLLQKPVNPTSPKLEHQSHTTLVIGFGSVGDDHRSVGCALCSVQQ